ncbi:hypothetical protein WJX72_012252 [[Myrmecia] bisecta]|uniref:EamA domain-containing protein n=1 Tax=[Myrmecia] bisecta TaxID=41462 RepID=A0AAW1Q1X5_9CHLO
MINLTATSALPVSPISAALFRQPLRTTTPASTSAKHSLLYRAARKLPILVNLCTATALTIISQLVNDQGMADNSVQVLAWVKYGSSLACSLLLQSAHKEDRKPVSQRASRLMTLVGLLDVFAYALQVWGFQLCGAALGTLIFAATGQTFTAALSFLFLGQRLSTGQLSAVALVCFGLFIRALAPSPSTASVSPASDGHWIADLTAVGMSGGQLTGVMVLLVSSLAYSVLGIAYDLLVRVEKQPPSHSRLMIHIAKIGFGANTLYQLCYTLPRWQPLISQPMVASGTSGWHAFALLCAFSLVYNVHSYCQGLVFRTEGALGVGLVTAVRGATVSLVAGSMFCSPAQPSQCMTAWSGASAGVITAGGVAWVVSKQVAAPPSATTPKLSRSMSSQKQLQILISQKSVKQQH